LYRILIADDEKGICEGIVKKIDWNAIGYTVAGFAYNGVDALEKAEKLHPDVIMTDIKMPFLSGLELCRKLHAVMPAIKFIIFSGFDDFRFAQEAIKLNVAEYILKPVNAQELTATLKKLKEQLDTETSQKCNIELLRKTYEQSFPIMRQQFFVGLIEGHIPKEQLYAQAQAFHLDTGAGGWAVALVRADSIVSEGSSFKGKEELIPISVKEIADGIFQSIPGESYVNFVYFDCVIIIVSFSDGMKIMHLCNGVNETCKEVNRVLGLKAMAGISTVKTDLYQLRDSYQEAVSALEYSGIMGGSKAIYIQDVEPRTPAKSELESEDEKSIVNLIKMGNEEKLKEEINRVFSHQKESLPTINQYKVFLMKIVTSVIKVLGTYDIDDDEIFSDNFPATMSKFHTPDEMKNWCMKVCLKINSEIKSKRVSNTKQLAQNAKVYIEQNYGNPKLSVDDLCMYLHVSPTYFSTVFKRETGKNFVSYLTDVRLQHAVDLLNTTEDKTYIIAQKVGYFEPNYFSYVFKKKYGISPSKYRNA